MKVLDRGWDRADFDLRFVPIIEQMVTDRGWIINSYAQVEFLAADLIVKARKFSAYEELNAKPLPFGIGGRITRVRELCRTGPLAVYADNLLPLLDRVLALEETRHFFTHGFLSVHIEKNGERMGMHLRRYVPPQKGKRETKSELFVLPEQMAQEKETWVRFAQTAVMIFREVYEKLGLETDDVTDGDPLTLGGK